VDWPVAGSNFFMTVAVCALVSAPLVGQQGGWRHLSRRSLTFAAAMVVLSFVVLTYSWREIAGGFAATAFGHLALVISVASLAELGRLVRIVTVDRLAGALAALGLGVLLVVGVFAVGPLADGLSTTASVWLLAANPLVSIASAAGIDLLHLDTIYRTSPLAHRGVVLPAWSTACAVYAVAGIAAHGASRLRPWSHSI